MTLLAIKDLEAKLERRDARIAELEAELAAMRAGGGLYAFAVHFPNDSRIELVHDLDDLVEDMTNNEYIVTALYTHPLAAQALDAVRIFWQQHTQSDALNMEMAELHADAERAIRAALAASQDAERRTFSDEELTAIYKEANNDDGKKAQPITTQRIFRAMRAIAAQQGDKT